MSGRLILRAALVAAVLACAPSSAPPRAADASGELVRYGFDDDVETGPDTLRVFQNASGSVRLSQDFAASGYRSVEIRDVAGDRDFPELLGRFPLRSDGRLYAHFALLVTNPAESFHVALAGPEWFRLKKDGIAFWLQGRDGTLWHVSDSIPKRLVPLRPFVWYTVDLAYDVAKGAYDLALREEGSREPVVRLDSQPNAASQPGSAVEVFSFIGDTGSDDSEIVYYVDDVVLTADRPVDTAPFVAPGRRKLFIDAWLDSRRRAAEGYACLPVSDVALDFGLSRADLAGASDGHAADVLRGALGPGRTQRRKEAGVSLPPQLAAVAAWTQGCEALRAEKIEEALAAFGKAEALWPSGRIYPLSRALALARARRHDEAGAVLVSIAGLFRDDPRLQMATALVGIARGDLDEALRVLAPPAEGLAVELGPDAGRLAEQYFLALLWNGSFSEAERYARGVEARLRETRTPAFEWTERAGDAAFFLGDAKRALDAYGLALRDGAAGEHLYEKLADACFRLGDLPNERIWREKVYGALR